MNTGCPKNPRVLLLLAVLLASIGCSSSGLPPHELSLRFTHPELYEARFDDARTDAIGHILADGLVWEGMKPEAVRAVLGRPDRYLQGNREVGGSDVRMGEPFTWLYEGVRPSGFCVHFGARGRVERIELQR